MILKHILKSCNLGLMYRYTSIRHSALFNNGPKATETFVYVTPHIDVVQIEDKNKLGELLKTRKSNISEDKVCNLWKAYKDLEQQMLDYDNKKSELSKELSKIIKENPTSNEVNKYKIKINLLKENIKKLKSPLWSAEENAILEILKLPNKVHQLTPESDLKIIHAHLSKPNNNKNHLNIGKELNIIQFKNNESYYLKNNGALFELGAKFYFSNVLKQYKFIQFSNPDFVKSVIVEGCGKNHTDKNSTFLLHHNEDTKVNPDSRLHLTGGASFESFMAYFSKNIVHLKNFPLKFFTMGRQYKPSPYDAGSLFHVSQASVIELFMANKDSGQVDDQLNSIIDILKQLYNSFGVHYCLCLEPAHKLAFWESLRLSIQMYSTSLGKYVEVGNISVSGDFICKRLMFTCTDKNVSKFPHLISGTILNVPRLLACILEQENSFILPEQLEIKNWAVSK